MKGFLKPVLGGNIIDASCASGLFSRLFAKSGWFSLVVALDYSENMLQQCYEFVQQEENFPKEYTFYISKLIIVYYIKLLNSKCYLLRKHFKHTF